MAGGVNGQGNTDTPDGRHLKKIDMCGEEHCRRHRAAAEKNQNKGADGLTGKVMQSIHHASIE